MASTYELDLPYVFQPPKKRGHELGDPYWQWRNPGVVNVYILGKPVGHILVLEYVQHQVDFWIVVEA